MEIIVSIILVFIFIMSIVSSFLKAIHFNFFYLNTYKMLNGKISLNIIKVISICFLLLEFIVPTLALSNLNLGSLSIFLLIFIYLLPTIVLIVAIQLGNKNIDCGCFGANIKAKVTWNKIVQNIIFIGILMYSLSMSSLIIEIWQIVFGIVLNIFYFSVLKINLKKKDGIHI